MWLAFEIKDGTLHEYYIPNLVHPEPNAVTYPEEVSEPDPPNAVEDEQDGEFKRTRYPRAKKRVDLRRRVLRKNAEKWLKQCLQSCDTMSI
jgi:hypothetical protein